MGVVAAMVLASGCAANSSRSHTTEPSPGPTGQNGPIGQTAQDGQTGQTGRIGEEDTRAGGLPDGGTSSCVEEYTPQGITDRAFALDGTVTAIGASDGSVAVDPTYVPVTFAAHEWFHGSETSTVTVDVASPAVEGHATSVSAGSFEVGSRLLVSGEPRWGGPALEDAVAWGCGFTRHYDEATADSWRTASN